MSLNNIFVVWLIALSIINETSGDYFKVFPFTMRINYTYNLTYIISPFSRLVGMDFRENT
jgi:hypothetical protein